MRRSGHAPLVSEPRRSHRPQQLASLLRAELGTLLPRELELPRNVVLTVSAVTVTADLSEARVGLSVLPFDRGEAVLALMARHRRDFQRTLFGRLKLYRVPRLEFYLDPTEERADKIERLLDHLS